MARENGSQGDGPDDVEPAWDADDVRRRKDQMAPPMEPCECFCLHCHRTFSSDAIWFQKINGSRDGFDGFWMCPTPNCGGAGFTFDIFPTDPNHPANDGWFGCSESGERSWEDDGEYEEFDDEDDDETTANNEYDPAEPRYKMMEQWDEADDDLEGEEWKYGLQPGQRPSAESPEESSAADWIDEQEKKYNEPDQRPRELDWTDSDRADRGGPPDEEIPY